MKSQPPRPITRRQFHRRVLAAATVTATAAVVPARAGGFKSLAGDKTLVAWVTLADLGQRGGSVLTLDDRHGHFDGIVFGELHPARWMNGSDYYRRTERDQDASPPEAAAPGTPVQVCAVYRGKAVILYRDGKEYARHPIGRTQAFGEDAAVVIGLRHLDAADRACFAGAILDARIYDSALTPEQIAALKPNQPSDPRPLAWWSFEDGTARDRMGAFPVAKLIGAARVVGGKLLLDGKESYLVTPPEAAPPPRPATRPPTTVPHYDSPIHYRPKVGRLADTIPFFWKGEYHVFYLRGNVGKVPWEHIVSRDLVHWRELQTALVSDGPADGPDGENMFTGSVTEKDGVFHLFYTGWNPRNPRGREFILHATSPDLVAWTKHPEDALGPDGVLYQNHQARDWRDADVIWNPDERLYWMVMCSNSRAGGGGVGLLTSADLKAWKHEPPLKGADAQECPDLFKIGDTWYLLGADHYAFADHARGPYRKPPVSPFIDRPNIYAGKRMFDGRRHVWTGWVWDIPSGRDGEGHTWGGTQCSPRELYAGPGGQLFCKPVAEVIDVFKKGVLKREAFRVDASSTFDVPDHFLIQCHIRLDPRAELTLALRQQPTGGAYRFVLDPEEKRATLSGPGFNYPRACPVDPSKPVKIEAFVQGTIIECFVNDQYAQTCRAYDYPKGKLAFEVRGGGATVLELSVREDERVRR